MKSNIQSLGYGIYFQESCELCLTLPDSASSSSNLVISSECFVLLLLENLCAILSYLKFPF